MQTNLELEIKNLLSQEESLEKVVEEAIRFVESSDEGISHDHVETLCRFLLLAQSGPALINFVRKHWHEQNFQIPWPYFIIALQDLINDDIAALLWEGIQEDQSTKQVSRCSVLDKFYPELVKTRQKLKNSRPIEFENQKRKMLEEISTLRLQRLYQQEKDVLGRLLRMFPGDPEILRENHEYKERNALDLINRLAPLRKNTLLDPELHDPEVEKATESWSRTFLEAAAKNPEMRIEFAVATFMMGLFDTSLKIINMSEDPSQHAWFRLEVLLRTRRYLDLLEGLAQIEIQFAHDPETFFATTYLRAQALWGLGQKHLAVETMESLLSARPQYRMGQSLLAQWRGPA